MSQSRINASGPQGPSGGELSVRESDPQNVPARDDQVNILIVDDRPENLITLAAILESPDLHIVQVTSGKEALRCVLNQDFAAILLDVNMPEMSGFETATFIRQRRSSARTPIIFVTAYSDEDHVYKGYSLGAVDYILTPVQPDVLRAKVAVFVDLFRKTLEIRRQAELLRQAEQKLRRRAERALADSEQRFRVTFNQAAVGMAIIDPAGEWLDVNQRLCDILRYPRQELLQQKLRDLISIEAISPEVDPFGPDADSKALEGWHRSIDGQLVWLHVVTSVARQPDGQPRYIIVVIEDVTARHRAEEQLKALNDELERRVMERTTALHNSHERLRRSERLASLGTLAAGIAHEINNPVNAILLTSQYALECPDEFTNGSLKEPFESIVREARRCGSIVKSVLRFAKEETTPKALHHLDGLLDRAATLARTYIQSPGLTLRVHADKNLPQLMLNPTQIEQVLINLIQNAVQAAPEGKVNIEIRTQLAPDHVKVSVSDDGKGIAPEKLLYIFDPFYSTRQCQGGTGLGLSIAHSIITDHGATIDVQSEPGQGTTFTISFPIPRESALPSTTENLASEHERLQAAREDESIPVLTT